MATVVPPATPVKFSDDTGSPSWADSIAPERANATSGQEHREQNVPEAVGPGANFNLSSLQRGLCA